jgi:RNA polymerase sigma-70 factor (ECF subfamily)
MDDMGRGLFPEEELTPEELQKQKEFKEEILPHLDLLYNFALRLTTDPADAEDLVQDTIVKAFRFFSSFEKGTNAKAWLYRILKNSYINNYRRKSKRPTEVDFDDVAPFYETIRDERTETSDMQEMLCDVDGFTYEEISNMLDVPIGTIRSRLHRGRNLLRTALIEYAKRRGFYPD